MGTHRSLRRRPLGAGTYGRRWHGVEDWLPPVKNGDLTRESTTYAAPERVKEYN